MMPAWTFVFIFLLASPGFAGDNVNHALGLTASGDFCEVIGAGEKSQRVSCFTVSRGAGGIQLQGVAYSWARERDDGVLVAPQLASWQLDKVASYDAASKTLVYEYSGTMRNTGGAFAGSSSVRFDFSSGKATKGWYGTSDDPIRFRLLPLDDLEACLGIDKPSTERQARYKRVATSSSEQLKGCVSAGFDVDGSHKSDSDE